MVALLFVEAVGLTTFAYVQGFGLLHSFAHVAVLIPLGVMALLIESHRRLASVLVSIGLITGAAALVHVWHGAIEAHFLFFVTIVVLALYEDWVPFLVAAGYVVLHHGLAGTIDASAVYNHADAVAHPWKWAAIHGAFVVAAGAAAVVAWRLNEDVRAEAREAYRQVEESASELEYQALHDSLTGLPNRRSLFADLERRLPEASSERPILLTLFDLNGFKDYNDTFGHPAGDALLTRVGKRLQGALGDDATAYRMGGDEFCTVAWPTGDDHAMVPTAAALALTERGESFVVTSSHGSVRVPDEAATAEAALKSADERMYLRKGLDSRASAGRQSADVLLTILSERSPSLGIHLDQVTSLAEAVAAKIGLPDDQVAPLLQAASLHDAGKVAIPDEILNKPRPLTDEEREFVRRHTSIGERVLSAAPALRAAAKLVRSSHERHDGTGYPDQLPGDEIPTGSRIIAVCDAYDAMISERPYRAARTPEDAVVELRRCAGTQFDPKIVDAFCEVIEEGAGRRSEVVATSPRRSSDLAAGAQVAEADREGHRFGPGVHLHPRDRVANVRVDGGGAEAEAVGDLLHAQALGQQLQDLALARGQLQQLLDLAGALAELGADEGAAARDDLDRAGDVLAGRRLQHVAGGAGAQGERQQVGLGVCGEDDHAGLGQRLEDVLGRLDPVLPRQLDVDDADVGLVLLDDADDLLAGGGLADDLDPGDRSHAGLDGLADDLVVVAEHDSFGSPAVHTVGMRSGTPKSFNTAGIDTLPSPSCPFSNKAIKVRPTATAVPLSV